MSIISLSLLKAILSSLALGMWVTRISERLTELADFRTGAGALFVLVDVGTILFLLGFAGLYFLTAVAADQFFSSFLRFFFGIHCVLNISKRAGGKAIPLN